VLESQKIVVANQTYGVSAGRIVNAQKSGQHGENWSIVLQIGNSGNNFLHLQIVDADVYTFAVEALASATKIKLFHIDQIRASRGNNRIDTYIWRIETMPGL
jgi:hypothetical protein